MEILKRILIFLKSIFLIILITFSFSLVIDFFFGKKILELTDNFWKKTEFYGRIKRIDHPIYHHGLKANVKMETARGFAGNYNFCTDNHGFRYKCDTQRGKKFDYGFMGDSFTEGSSVPYEKSFVGIFENVTKKSVANLGVVSYAPKIYLSKLNYLLNNGYEFENIVVVIDISDLYDDNVYYRMKENLVVDENYDRGERLRIRKFLRKNFPFTNFYMFVVKNLGKIGYSPEVISKDKPSFHKDVLTKAKWTYSPNDLIDGYWGSIKESQNSMINTMTELYNLLERKNISLSVVIFPWPQQLENDTVNSRHVLMWKKFCEKKCKNFINLFPTFFEEKNKNGYLNTYKKYFWWNDMHFNYAGNKLVADEIIKVIN